MPVVHSQAEAGDFTVHVTPSGGSPASNSVTAAVTAGNAVSLELADGILATDTVTITYANTGSSTSALRDVSTGVYADAFSTQAVTNNVRNPVLLEARTPAGAPNTIVLTFDQQLMSRGGPVGCSHRRTPQ